VLRSVSAVVGFGLSLCARGMPTLVRDPQGDFKTQAILCTDLNADPENILSWFARRWQIEATFQEVRRHLGFETQRQWSELAIQRSTPALLGLFSLVTLFAHRQMRRRAGAFRQAAWYHKTHTVS
jgi:MYXO-CTERM domain-containing protein